MPIDTVLIERDVEINTANVPTNVETAIIYKVVSLLENHYNAKTYFGTKDTLLHGYPFQDLRKLLQTRSDNSIVGGRICRGYN